MKKIVKNFNEKTKVLQPIITNNASPNPTNPRYTVNFRTKFGIPRRGKLTPKAIDYLALLLEEWIDNDPRALDFKTFLNWHRIYGAGGLLEMAEKSENLKEAYKYAKQRIAANREKLALFKKLEPKVFSLMQHNYDSEWAKSEERQAKLKNQEDQQALNREVIKALIKDITEPVKTEPVKTP